MKDNTEIIKLREKLARAYDTIDTYFESKYRKANTLERIKMRGVQRAINKVVEVELLLEAESNQ